MVSVLDGMVRIVVLALVTLVTGNFVLVGVVAAFELECVCMEVVILGVLACEEGGVIVVLCVVSSVVCAIVVVLYVVMACAELTLVVNGVLELDKSLEMLVLESSVVLIVWVSVVVLAMVEGTDIIVV